MPTLRTSDRTHSTLKSLAAETGESITHVLDRAVETYSRTIFLEGLNADFEALRSRADEWNEEMDERKLWESTLADGLPGK
jgi:hypothetical protein